MRTTHGALAALLLITAGCGSAPPKTGSRLEANLEPLGCPLYGGTDRPDYDAQGLHCLVDWLGQAQDYLARGGKPTAHTGEEAITRNRALALELAARLRRHLASPRAPAVPSAAVAAPSVPIPTVDSRASSQAYLEGLIHFQKGDQASARAVWEQALRLDPSNSDAKEALEKLAEPEKAP